MVAFVNFFDALLNRARREQQAGQLARAGSSLTKLLSFPDLPAESTAEAHARAGELHLKARRFGKARRHLRAALRLAPDAARLHHRLGLSLASDPRGSDEVALRHYRRAIELAPDRARWRGEAGLLAIRLGKVDYGLALLRQAVDQAPGDFEALSPLVKGLRQAGRPEEALRRVRQARFASPHCPKVRQLEADLLLARIRRDQAYSKAQSGIEEAILLPFQPRQTTPTRDRRHDGPQTLPGPHLARVNARLGGSRR